MFKIAVFSKKTGKRTNYLCKEHRYIGNIWCEEREFKTEESAKKFIKQHYHAGIENNYRWEVVEVMVSDILQS